MPGSHNHLRTCVRSVHAFTIIAAAALLVSCGGDEGSAGDASGGPPPSPTPPAGDTNAAPSIAGKPPASVLQSTEYSFRPTASDPDGDSLTFGIVNKPGWATFNRTTGRLRGTPAPGEVGTYANIEISVSDGRATASLADFTVAVVATASGAVSLSWTSPTQNSDGTPLTDLAGFKIYWGMSEGSYPNSVTIANPGVTRHVVEQLTPGTWFFVATALDSSGNESPFSNAASKTVL